jgi:hypothetical protein
MRWIGTLGGPLVVMPLEYVGLWTGASGPNGEEEWDEDDTLYWRASEATDGYAGVVPVGPAEALVIGSGRAPTTYFPEYRTFVQRLSGDAEADFPAYVGRILAAAVWEHEVAWAFDGRSAVMFDAVHCGPDLTDDDLTPLPIEPGRYTVRCCHMTPSVTGRHYTSLIKLGAPHR